MTAFKSATRGLIALSILVSAPFFCPVLGQEKVPPLGNVADEDDPGLRQIQQRLEDEQSRATAYNRTYDFSKKTRQTATASSSGSSTASSTGTVAVSEIQELDAKPQLKAALITVRAELIKGDWEAAISQLEAIIRRDPAGITARRFLAYAFLRSGSPDAAVRQLLSYTKVVEPTATDDYLLGTAYNAIGDLEGARDAFKDAIARDPNMDSARAELVKVLVSSYNYDAALAICLERLKQVKDARTQAYYRNLYASVELAKRSGDLFPPASQPQKNLNPVID